MLIERRDDFFRPLRELQREIDRLFDGFFRGGRSETGYYPAVDIYETNDAVMIEVEVPGMSKDDIKITVEDNVLRIHGEKKLEREEKDRNYYVVERSYGTFERAFRLPDYVDSEKIKAKFENGVLTITLPKREEEKKKVIDVQIE